MDIISLALNSNNYLQSWNPDFLSKPLGKRGTVARYYPNNRLAVDVGNPNTRVYRRKKHLLNKQGFSYLCIPPNCKLEDLQLMLLTC
jgi:hypothetical protein